MAHELLHLELDVDGWSKPRALKGMPLDLAHALTQNLLWDSIEHRVIEKRANELGVPSDKSHKDQLVKLIGEGGYHGNDLEFPQRLVDQYIEMMAADRKLTEKQLALLLNHVGLSEVVQTGERVYAIISKRPITKDSAPGGI